MNGKLISYEITINHVNGRTIVVYNSFKSIIDIIKNYTQYNDVKNMKIKPDIFSKNEELKIAAYISQYLG